MLEREPENIWNTVASISYRYNPWHTVGHHDWRVYAEEILEPSRELLLASLCYGDCSIHRWSRGGLLERKWKSYCKSIKEDRELDLKDGRCGMEEWRSCIKNWSCCHSSAAVNLCFHFRGCAKNETVKLWRDPVSVNIVVNYLYMPQTRNYMKVFSPSPRACLAILSAIRVTEESQDRIPWPFYSYLVVGTFQKGRCSGKPSSLER